MDDVEVAYAPAWLQARWIRDKEISCRELVDLYLGRIDRVNVALNCFITVAREYAQEAADEADRKAAGERGPFHGVPIAIKDMADTAEIRTTWGSAGFRDRVPHRDSPAVRRLKASGFLILGKTNTPEFASGPTDPVGYGPCRNPWDPDRSVFGSSGGSAAAAAAALCAVAHGSDAGGSIREPAAACGVVGFKPSRGRVSNDLPGFDYLNQEGPITRTVTDAAAVLDCMAGSDPGDPYRAAALERPMVEEVVRTPKPLRIAYMTPSTRILREGPGLTEIGLTAEPVMWDAVLRAAAVLDGLGHYLKEDGPNWGGSMHEVALHRYHAAAWLAHEDVLPRFSVLDPIQQAAFDGVRALSLKSYLQTLNAAQVCARDVERFWTDFDIALMPTLARLPPLVADLRDADGRTTAVANGGPFTFFWNITGQPAVSLPLYQSAGGLPVGVQLVGRVGDEATLFRVSGQLEGAMPWASRRPPGAGV